MLPSLDHAFLDQCFVLGGHIVDIFLFDQIPALCLYLYSPIFNSHRYNHGKKPWALVTGASDLIGRAISRELARRDFNVILHGRNELKLNGVRQQMIKEFPHLNFRIAIADAAGTGPETTTQINGIVQGFKDLNVTVLVNNVGGPSPGMTPLHKTFDKNTPSDIDGVTAMNNRFTTHLTAAVLPTLLQHQPSLIMSIGSMANTGTPYVTMYSGVKAFLATWSMGLAREMRAEGRDVEILCVVAGSVTGVSFRKEPASLAQPTAEIFAAAALDRVGCGQVVLPGYWGHAVLKVAMGILPEFILGESTCRRNEERGKEECEKRLGL